MCPWPSLQKSKDAPPIPVQGDLLNLPQGHNDPSYCPLPHMLTPTACQALAQAESRR